MNEMGVRTARRLAQFHLSKEAYGYSPEEAVGEAVCVRSGDRSFSVKPTSAQPTARRSRGVMARRCNT